ncbi:MAG: 4-hydroxythreonine-4-phosphate dehydrogenase PdxA [Pirellulaceae bacterium]|nr:4-hydroxythreonine-4-phosphate dehydrogenase PdxA [Pirellulaceae bacterium]
MGDPAGVGPELCLRLLAEPRIGQQCVPIVFGDAELLHRVARQLGLPWHAPVISAERWSAEWSQVREPAVLDLRRLRAEEVVPGRVEAACGDAAYRCVMAAIDAGLAGQVAAVATAPLHKEALYAAGHHYPGHTEIFAERLHAPRSCMMLTSELITCSLVTVHVGYDEVPDLLSVERILDVIELTDQAMARIRGRRPRLIACGLNPHAGENGLFGRREEQRVIGPAVERARAAGIQISGPASPDTAFIPSLRQTTDAYVCMYHDQGLIPVKALAFDSAINITLGLPWPRTSVDHGTAFDIAWQGLASPHSLFEAVRLAARLAV